MKQKTILIAGFAIFAFLAFNVSTTARADTNDVNDVFANAKPFDLNAYVAHHPEHSHTKTMQFHGAAGSIFLYRKQGAESQLFGRILLSGSGKIILGSEGLLAYPETFVKFIPKKPGKDIADIADAIDIGRRAIKDGRLYIETKGEKQTFTISNFNFDSDDYTAVIEPGIQVKP